jgi:HAE1 family hydrophobic/amphiphilic exporter-1
MTIAVSGREDPARGDRDREEADQGGPRDALRSRGGAPSSAAARGRSRSSSTRTSSSSTGTSPSRTCADALVKENQEQPEAESTGPARGGAPVMGRVRQPADFEKLIVANRNGQPSASRTSAAWRTRSRSPGDRAGSGPGAPAVRRRRGRRGQPRGRKQSGTNTVQVADDGPERLGEIRPLPAARHPGGGRPGSVALHPAAPWRGDAAPAPRGVLVSLTILLFIRDIRTTIIATLRSPPPSS